MVHEVVNNMHQLTNKITAGKYWPIRRALDDVFLHGMAWLCGFMASYISRQRRVTHSFCG